MIYETFREKNSELRGKRLIIGVSGGVDSMVLLHLCHELGAEITGVHVNYGLRGEDSDGDETFTHEYCTQLGIECRITQVNAIELKGEGMNLQQKAREIRYKAYSESLKITESNYILTAHHLDDSIETTVMNFFRGTDLSGLTGIKDWDLFRRPLLAFTKSEIIDYAQANNIPYREDKSNATEDYTRNRIRNSLLPELENIFPHVKTRLATTIANLNAIHHSHQKAMDYLISQFVTPSGIDQLLPFDKVDSDLEEQVLIYWGGQYGLSRAQMQNLYTIKDRVGKKVETSDIDIIIDREGYLLVKKDGDNSSKPIQITQAGFTLPISQSQLNITDNVTQGKDALHSISLNEELLIYPLTVRYWMPGDRVTYSQAPTQSKKLKKLFNDHKVKSTDKHRTPILVNGDGTIIWVIGLQKNPSYLSDKGYSIYVVNEGLED